MLVPGQDSIILVIDWIEDFFVADWIEQHLCSKKCFAEEYVADVMTWKDELLSMNRKIIEWIFFNNLVLIFELMIIEISGLALLCEHRRQFQFHLILFLNSFAICSKSQYV